MRINSQLDIMRSIASNLHRMVKEGAITGSPTLPRLEACKVQAQERAGTDSNPPVDMVSIASGRKAWNDAAGRVDSLDRRTVRVLCWDPETCLRPSFYRPLSKAGIIEQRAVLLRGMLTSYFQSWTADEWDKELAHYLTACVRRFTGSSKVLNSIRTEGTRLLARDGPGALAADFLDRRIEPKQLFEHFGIPSASRFAIACLSSAIHLWAEWLNSRRAGTEVSILDSWGFLRREILAAGTITSGDIGLLISAIVLLRNIEEMPGLQAEVRSFALGHPQFGDPRLHPNRWVGVREDARRRFLNWLAKEWITFFFEEVLRKGADPHKRKDFWLQYAHNRNIVNFSVVLNNSDFFRLKQQIERHKASTWVCRNLDIGAASAFILQFHGAEPITVIEFSLTGNASRIYRTNEFQQRVGPIFGRQFSRRDLQSDTAIERIIHLPVHGWQRNAETTLAQYGVRR